jgi:hypothetical protein
MARDVVAQMVRLQPELPEGSRVFVVGLPGWYGHAHAFDGGGLGGAIRLAYGKLRPEIYRSVDPALVAWLASHSEGAPADGHYTFWYDGGTVRDVSA